MNKDENLKLNNSKIETITEEESEIRIKAIERVLKGGKIKDEKSE